MRWYVHGGSCKRCGEPYIWLEECRVLPASAWVEVEASAVEVDGRREVLRVTKAASFPLDAHDFAVQAFGDAVGDGVPNKAKHAREMGFQHPRHLLDGVQDRKSTRLNSSH